jgi:oligopeptide transport system substrate-binding protein
MAQAAKEANAEKRQQLLHQAEEVFLADLPLIPIYHYTNKYLVSDRVDGWVENVLGYNLSRYLSIKG